MDPEPSCPRCGQSDRVRRASAVYIAGLELKYPRRRSRSGQNPIQDDLPGKQDPSLADFASWEEIPPGGLVGIAKRLAPPSSARKLPTRPIHPDLVMLVFSLVMPVFIIGILTTQPGMLLIALPLLAGLYAFYFWQRRNLVARYDHQINNQRASDERIKRAIERWMWLRYCARDQVVFIPGHEAVALDQMNLLLFP